MVAVNPSAGVSKDVAGRAQVVVTSTENAEDLLEVFHAPGMLGSRSVAYWIFGVPESEGFQLVDLKNLPAGLDVTVAIARHGWSGLDYTKYKGRANDEQPLPEIVGQMAAPRGCMTNSQVIDLVRMLVGYAHSDVTLPSVIQEELDAILEAGDATPFRKGVESAPEPAKLEVPVAPGSDTNSGS